MGDAHACGRGDRTSLSATTEQLKIRNFARMRAHGPRADFAIVPLTRPMPPPLILDPKTLDLSRVIADQEAIRPANAHRGHMEPLTAVVYMDTKGAHYRGVQGRAAGRVLGVWAFPELPVAAGVISARRPRNF